MNTKERIVYAISNPRRLLHITGLMLERVLMMQKQLYPFILQINLDTVCNVKCFFCAYDGRSDKPGDFDIDKFWKLERAVRHAKYIALSAWGDPLCSPNLYSVLQQIYSWNNSDGLIAIVTNGTMLNTELACLLTGHLADMTVSLNAAKPYTYNRDIKGGNWNRTIEAVKSFAYALSDKDKTKINLHFVAHRNNYLEIPDLIDLAVSLDIRRVRVDQFTVNKREYMPLSLMMVKREYNNAISLARHKAEKYGVSLSARTFGTEKRRNTCLFPWISTCIWADGRVAPCDCNGTLFIGNVYQTNFEHVWFGKEYAEFRRKGAPQCEYCPMALPFDNPRAHLSPYLNEVLNENPTRY